MTLEIPTQTTSLLASSRTLVWFVVVLLLPACTPSGQGADPGITDSPVAYIKRAMPVDNDGDLIQPDLREPLAFTPGGDVFVKERASAGATESNITNTITAGRGDVRDISPSWDGNRILFSLRTEDPDDNDNIFHTWNIYEYDLATRQLRRVINSDTIADEADDVSPAYLPDGRIVFSSNRQTQSKAILLDEGVVGISKPQFSATDEDRRTRALVLHVMNADGTAIEQITFNQSHDLDPFVMDNGRILFSRWDNSGRNDAMHLYTVLPDGSDLQPWYGTHVESHVDADGNIVQLIRPYALSSGDIMAMSQPFTDSYGGGNIVLIDAENYIDLYQPTTENLGILSGPASTNATITDIVNSDAISPNGRYSSAYPLQDGTERILVSKGACQLQTTVTTSAGDTTSLHPCIEPWLSDATAVETTPAYGIWIYDRGNDTEKPIVIAEAGMITTGAVSLQPRTVPAIIAGGNFDATLATEGAGILNIRSVYDFGDGSFNGCFFDVCTPAPGINSVQQLGDPGLTGSDDRPARFLRIVKPAGLPLRNDERLSEPPDLAGTAFGPERSLGMREIVGYIPIAPDGSVQVKVPANIAFSIEVLDKFARRIGPRHDNWLQLRPGETLDCNGCHTHATGNARPLPHARRDAVNASINTGAPFDGYLFPNTQIPGTSAVYFGDAGDTMAEARNRQVPSSLVPDLDVLFVDVWSDPSVTTVDTPFEYTYSGTSGLTTENPTSLSCNTAWSVTCRSVINYTQHIDPLWSVDRGANTCTDCHSTKDMAGNNKVPSAQLDLSSEVSDEEADHLESYRELLFDDEGMTLNLMGELVPITTIVPVLDENGDPVLDNNGNLVTEEIPDPAASVQASMSANGARASYFMEKMTETEIDAERSLPVPTVDHAGFLTAAELRLLSEWLDLGAQYFNNPFDPSAPMN